MSKKKYEDVELKVNRVTTVLYKCTFYLIFIVIDAFGIASAIYNMVNGNFDAKEWYHLYELR